MVEARPGGVMSTGPFQHPSLLVRLVHAGESQPLGDNVEKLIISLREVAMARGVHEAWPNVGEPWVRHTGRVRSTRAITAVPVEVERPGFDSHPLAAPRGIITCSGSRLAPRRVLPVATDCVRGWPLHGGHAHSYLGEHGCPSTGGASSITTPAAQARPGIGGKPSRPLSDAVPETQIRTTGGGTGELFRGTLSKTPWQYQGYSADSAAWLAAAPRRHAHRRRTTASLGVASIDLSGPHEPTPVPTAKLGHTPAQYFLVMSFSQDTTVGHRFAGTHTGRPDE